MLGLLALWVSALALAGPVDAQKMGESNAPHRLIVAYLSQTSADPAVCDLDRRDGPAIQLADKRFIAALGKGFAQSEVSPTRFEACSLNLFRSADPILLEQLRAGLERSLSDYSKQVGRDPGAIERGRALLSVVVDRVDPEPLETKKLLGRYRDVLADLPRDAPEHAVIEQLVEALETEAGVAGAEVITKARVDAETFLPVLEVWAKRLPDPILRTHAVERLLAKRIEKSPFAWVVDNPDLVKERVREGPLDIPRTLPIRTARFAPEADGTALLRVLQAPPFETTRLVPVGADGTPSADPSLDLVGALWFEVEGLERPITVCTQARLDVTPCVAPSRLDMVHPVAVLAETGRVTFPTELSLGEVLQLGSDGDRLSAQVVADGVVAEVDLPIQFDTVPDLYFGPIGSSGNGPIVRVDVWELSNARLLIEARSPPKSKKKTRVVVESTDRLFTVGSYGVQSDASVGRGGDVRVWMRCTNCAAVRETLKRMCVSGGNAPGRVTIQKVDEDGRRRRVRTPAPRGQRRSQPR
jgi:hypothetical protein